MPAMIASFSISCRSIKSMAESLGIYGMFRGGGTNSVFQKEIFV